MKPDLMRLKAAYANVNKASLGGDLRVDTGEGMRGPQPKHNEDPGYEMSIESIQVNDDAEYRYTAQDGSQTTVPGFTLDPVFCLMDPQVNDEGIEITNFNGEPFDFPKDIATFMQNANKGNKTRFRMTAGRLFGFYKVMFGVELKEPGDIIDAAVQIVQRVEEAAAKGEHVFMRVGHTNKKTQSKKRDEDGNPIWYTNCTQKAKELLSGATAAAS